MSSAIMGPIAQYTLKFPPGGNPELCAQKRKKSPGVHGCWKIAMCIQGVELPEAS